MQKGLIVFLLTLAVVSCIQPTTDSYPTYSVTYDGNGNTGGIVPVDSNNYKKGDTVTVASCGTMICTGHTFTGWNTSADGSGTDHTTGSTFSIGASDVTLYAQWTTNPTYTVTYEGNGSDGGTVPVDSNSYEEGATVKVASKGTMSFTGHTFTGWNTIADGSGIDRAAGSTFTMGAGHVTLYAQWAVNPTYTVTYYGNGSDGGSVPVDSNSYEEGETVTVAMIGTMSRTGHTFIGWNTVVDGNGTDHAAGSTFSMGTSDVTLYAQWSIVGPGVYAAGVYVKTGGASIPGYWNNGTWVDLPMLDATQGIEEQLYLTIDGSDVYVGGSQSLSGGGEVPGYWKNCNWHSLPAPSGGEVNSLFVDGSDVYAAGRKIDDMVGVPGYWKNDVWHSLPPIDVTQGASVQSLVVDGTDVYAGGCYSDNSMCAPVYWKNDVWYGLPRLDATKSGTVYPLVVDGTDVYAGGSSTDSSDKTIPGYWKNGTWIGLPSLANGGIVPSLVVDGTDVYAGGIRWDNAWNEWPGYWKNGTWNALPILVEGANAVYSLVIVGNDVYAGGYRTNSSGTIVAGYWKNGNWNSLLPPVVTRPSGVTSLVVVE